MPIEGYKVRTIQGDVFGLAVERTKGVIEGSGDFVERFPPQKGDELLQIKWGVRESIVEGTGFIFEELVDDDFGTNHSQRWRFVLKR